MKQEHKHTAKDLKNMDLAELLHDLGDKNHASPKDWKVAYAKRAGELMKCTNKALAIGKDHNILLEVAKAYMELLNAMQEVQKLSKKK